MPKQTMVAIDTDFMRSWLDSRTETYRELAVQIGKGSSYFSSVLKHGEMPELVFNMFVKVFELDAEQFKEKPKPIEPPTQPAKARYCAEPIIEGYEMTLQVRPSRVRVGLSFKGQEVCYSWANIKGNSESDLLQAISYAAHQNYKFAQIKYFGCGYLQGGI